MTAAKELMKQYDDWPGDNILVLRNNVTRPHRLYAVHRCCLLPQMSHVEWSVCLGHMDELCRYGLTDRDAIWGQTPVNSRNHISDGHPETM